MGLVVLPGGQGVVLSTILLLLLCLLGVAEACLCLGCSCNNNPLTSGCAQGVSCGGGGGVSYGQTPYSAYQQGQQTYVPPPQGSVYPNQVPSYYVVGPQPRQNYGPVAAPPPPPVSIAPIVGPPPPVRRIQVTPLGPPPPLSSPSPLSYATTRPLATVPRGFILIPEKYLDSLKNQAAQATAIPVTVRPSTLPPTLIYTQGSPPPSQLPFTVGPTYSTGPQQVSPSSYTEGPPEEALVTEQSITAVAPQGLPSSFYSTVAPINAFPPNGGDSYQERPAYVSTVAPPDPFSGTPPPTYISPALSLREKFIREIPNLASEEIEDFISDARELAKIRSTPLPPLGPEAAPPIGPGIPVDAYTPGPLGKGKVALVPLKPRSTQAAIDDIVNHALPAEEYFPFRQTDARVEQVRKSIGEEIEDSVASLNQGDEPVSVSNREASRSSFDGDQKRSTDSPRINQNRNTAQVKNAVLEQNNDRRPTEEVQRLALRPKPRTPKQDKNFQEPVQAQRNIDTLRETNFERAVDASQQDGDRDDIEDPDQADSERNGNGPEQDNRNINAQERLNSFVENPDSEKPSTAEQARDGEERDVRSDREPSRPRTRLSTIGEFDREREIQDRLVDQPQHRNTFQNEDISPSEFISPTRAPVQPASRLVERAKEARPNGFENVQLRNVERTRGGSREQQSREFERARTLPSRGFDDRRISPPRQIETTTQRQNPHREVGFEPYPEPADFPNPTAKAGFVDQYGNRIAKKTTKQPVTRNVEIVFGGRDDRRNNELFKEFQQNPPQNQRQPEPRRGQDNEEPVNIDEPQRNIPQKGALFEEELIGEVPENVHRDERHGDEDLEPPINPPNSDVELLESARTPIRNFELLTEPRNFDDGNGDGSDKRREFLYEEPFNRSGRLNRAQGSKNSERARGSKDIERAQGSEDSEWARGSKDIEKAQGSKNSERSRGPMDIERTLSSEHSERARGTKDIERDQSSRNNERSRGPIDTERTLGSEYSERTRGSKNIERAQSSRNIEQARGPKENERSQISENSEWAPGPKDSEKAQSSKNSEKGVHAEFFTRELIPYARERPVEQPRRRLSLFERR